MKHTHTRFAGIALLAVCFSTGCATVRRAREAQDPAHVPPGQRTVTAAEVGLSSNSILKLDQAVRIALAAHPAIAQALQSVDSASNQLVQARAAYGPTVDAGAGYRRATSNSKDLPSSSHSGGAYSASLSLDQLAYDFGRTPAVVRQAWARKRAAEESLLAARNDVIFGVRTAFFDLGRSLELLRVAEDTVRQFTVHMEETRVLVEVGRRIKYDITKADVDLGNARLNLIGASNSVVTARASLNRSLGLAEEPGYRIADPPAEEIAAPFEDLMGIARKQHPELQALRAQELVASAALDETIADLYPSLSLSAGYTWGGSAFPLFWNWAAAAQAGMNLFSTGRKTSRIEVAVADLRAARAKVADREQQIYLDLRSAVAQLDAARQRMALTDLIVRQAQESLDLVTERYKLGQASSVEQTDAQVSLTQARANQVNARFDYQTATATIKHTIGEE